MLIERLALQWIQKYILAFGGDPSKVTMFVPSILFEPLLVSHYPWWGRWGESAGSIAVSLQLLTNGGNSGGLYRGAFLESGSPYPVGNATAAQPSYDNLVADTGCAGAPDTLKCLANLPLANLTAAVNRSPNFFQVSAPTNVPSFIDGISYRWQSLPNSDPGPGLESTR